MSIDEKRVREFAFQIWESEGKPEGQAERHWQMAIKLAQSEAAVPAASKSVKGKTLPAPNPAIPVAKKPAKAKAEKPALLEAKPAKPAAKKPAAKPVTPKATTPKAPAPKAAPQPTASKPPAPAPAKKTADKPTAKKPGSKPKA